MYTHVPACVCVYLSQSHASMASHPIHTHSLTHFPSTYSQGQVLAICRHCPDDAVTTHTHNHTHSSSHSLLATSYSHNAQILSSSGHAFYLTRVHVHAHALTHMVTHTSSHRHMLSHTCSHTHALSQTLTHTCLLYTSPSPRDRQKSRMPSSA